MQVYLRFSSNLAHASLLYISTLKQASLLSCACTKASGPIPLIINHYYISDTRTHTYQNNHTSYIYNGRREILLSGYYLREVCV
jgi:hypothetical protein